MVGGKGGDGGEAADRGEGANAELHHERHGREKMRGEGGAMLAEWVGRVVVGLVLMSYYVLFIIIYLFIISIQIVGAILCLPTTIPLSVAIIIMSFRNYTP